MFLEEVPACAGGQGTMDVLIAIVGGEHDDARVRVLGKDGSGSR
jgi:hypothetical protein